MKRVVSVCVLLCSLLLVTVTHGAQPHPAPRAEQVVAFTFDWDDNVFEMPTKIWLFHKRTGIQVGVSTDQFALIREEIGKPGTRYAGYELRPAKDVGSLRHFGDYSSDGSRRFQSDVDEAMRGSHWKGPVWNDFVSATSQARTARHTWFITARLHAPETIHGALKSFQKKGLIGHSPPVDNVWPVADPKFSERFTRIFGVPAPEGGAASPSARKAAVMEQILDHIEVTPLPATAAKVLSPDGSSHGPYHLWGFSDDDLGNYSKAVEVLQRGVDARRWPHVKITVFYTGTNRPEVKPHAVTLVAGAAPRPFTEGPTEWKSVMAP